MNTKELGILGEKIAGEYLVKNGFKILERNWRISFGEIDIVVRKKARFFGGRDKTIHFVEVKTIFSNKQHYFPQDHVDFRKQQKLRQLCQIWLKRQKLPQDFPHQIDVIAVTIQKNQPQLDYFPNAVADS